MGILCRLNGQWVKRSVLAVLLVVSWSWAGPGRSDAADQVPPSTPPGLARGQAAIDALGPRLPDVAAAYGMTAEELRDLFLQDHTLRVDSTGELLHVDDAFASDSTSSRVTQLAPAAAPFPTEQTFLLHSLPGASHTIYLDFDGHITEGTSWNSGYSVTTIVSPPYDIDGNPSTFSTTEIERIQKTWQIVAEDFSPFNVNVTTEDPGAAALRDQGGGDAQWGTRVVITDDTFANCGCGGHAYIGSFDDYQDEPVFVYNQSLTGVAEASTHEVGHAILLSHDGTSTETYYWGHGSGETSWAPIMGAGYNKNVTQWCRGEYYDANNGGSGANYGHGPDDLAVIASLSNGNGFGYRPDDHGDSQQTATPLAVSGNAVSGSGIVERTGDVDVFSFTTQAGQVSLNIVPAVPNPNLDVLAELYDGGWNRIGVSDPASKVGASLSTVLAQGTYYLTVDGTGTGSPYSSTPTGYTEYGSIGQYAISGTAVNPGGSNNPPAFDSDPVVEAGAIEDAAYNGTLGDDASDPDGDGLTFAKVSGPAWLAIAGGGALSGTPANGDVGLNSWVVTVSDGNGGSDQATLQITVINTNDPPTLNTDPIVKANATVDVAYSDTLAGDATDPDGDSLTFSKVSGPAWLLVADNGALSGIPADGAEGLNSWVVKVNDGNVGTDQGTLQITVDEAVPFLYFFPTGEIVVSGSTTGSYLDTHDNDGLAEVITERQSGGKPSKRHSLLEHKWVFAVQPGASVTLFANAWATPSTDGDTFVLAYSTDDDGYVTLDPPVATSGDGDHQTFALPNDLDGTVYVRILDSDRSQGNSSLDTVYVDHLYIRSDTEMPDPPGAPSDLSAVAAGASQIDLSWVYGLDDELGFHIQRSPDGSNGWTQVAEVGTNVTAYSDTGLDPETTYHYRVLAFNAAGEGGTSDVASDTTGTAGSVHVDAMVGSSTSAKRGRWNATVTITIVDQTGTSIADASVFGDWGNGASGSASCVTVASGECPVTKANNKSNVAGITFSVSDVQHATNTYVASSNVITSVVVLSP